MKKMFTLGFVFMLSMSFTGCTFIFQKGRRSDIEKIEKLSMKVDDLAETKKMLEQKLKQEIKDKQMKLTMMKKGLVITYVADILFDSGKAKLKTESLPGLEKIATVLQENASRLKVGIEGHTDNQPIKFSGWKSNWELSAARGLSVLHYLVKSGVSEDRLSAIAYGEYQPVVSNDTQEGQQINRRVEIVILPRMTKDRNDTEAPPAEIEEQGVSEAQQETHPESVEQAQGDLK